MFSPFGHVHKQRVKTNVAKRRCYLHKNEYEIAGSNEKQKPEFFFESETNLFISIVPQDALYGLLSHGICFFPSRWRYSSKNSYIKKKIRLVNIFAGVSTATSSFTWYMYSLLIKHGRENISIDPRTTDRRFLSSIRSPLALFFYVYFFLLPFKNRGNVYV